MEGLGEVQQVESPRASADASGALFVGGRGSEGDVVDRERSLGSVDDGVAVAFECVA